MKKSLLIICLALVVTAGAAIGVFFFLKSQDMLRTPGPEISQDLAAKSPYKLVSIPAGSFMMGSYNGNDDEKPVHKVTLTKPFYMGATEVTQSQWKAVMGGNPSFFKGDDLPVEEVSWNECIEFCKKLTETEKAKGNLPADWVYRLPTEAEWEYCCRAGSATEYCFGDAINILKNYAWFDDNSGRKTHRVGTKKANAWGLYDMHGNLWEWCLDRYGKYTSGDATDPLGPSSGSFRVGRGGSWLDRAVLCRSAIRTYSAPGYARNSLGFRLVLAQHSEKSVDPNTAPPVVDATVQDLAAKSPLKLVSIPAGSFMMGSNDGDSYEKPVHKVTISKPFYMGATEVTQSQWKMIMGNNPSYFKGDDLPVDYISWKDCMEFCKKLTVTEKAKGNLPADWEYRLPTEAEWEYCCRAGSSTEYCFGEDKSRFGEYAWFCSNSNGETHPVGIKKPNAWGLYDMHGNVYEWCLDRYGEYTSGDVTDPLGPSSGSDRVGRGGSWFGSAWSCRSATRGYSSPVFTDGLRGFRIVLAIVQR